MCVCVWGSTLFPQRLKFLTPPRCACLPRQNKYFIDKRENKRAEELSWAKHLAVINRLRISLRTISQFFVDRKETRFARFLEFREVKIYTFFGYGSNKSGDLSRNSVIRLKILNISFLRIRGYSSLQQSYFQVFLQLHQSPQSSTVALQKVSIQGVSVTRGIFYWQSCARKNRDTLCTCIFYKYIYTRIIYKEINKYIYKI